jgi:hypothetical protein
MFAAGLAAGRLQKNEEQVAIGPTSVTCSLCSKIREKRIRDIALGRHKVFPVTPIRYSSIAKGLELCD